MRQVLWLEDLGCDQLWLLNVDIHNNGQAH